MNRLAPLRAGLGLTLLLAGASAPILAACSHSATPTTPLPPLQALTTPQRARPDLVGLDLAPGAASTSARALAPSADGEIVAIARAFLAANGPLYGVDATTIDAFAVLELKRSLAGAHVSFQEVHGGVPVADSTVSVSLDARGEVYRVHSKAGSAGPFDVAEGLLGEPAARDIAWKELRAHGRLLSEPSTTLLYAAAEAKRAGAARLFYRVHLELDAPRGAWQVDVDAKSGAVLGVVDTTRHSRRSTAVDYRAYQGPIADLRAALESVHAISAARQRAVPPQRADGTALVFDPDPVTALGDAGAGLTDTSPADAFLPAYKEVVLHDLSLDGQTYRLDGPWVRLGDFESPTVAPSTTTSGHWLAKRGDDAFDDVMVYFHIDHTQRYLQSLGFMGARGIQFGPIEVDSDGVDGDDNSHFVPSANRLAFGHGCVNDSEDADVILHEYGHAITFSINHGFDGGDTGAIGEGFGDYWAASYEADDPRVTPSAKVYTWDSAGGCWPGRRADRTEYRYDPSKTYGAHETVGGVDSDELWSTPLFQGMLALRRLGVPRREVDTIYLEAQFGFTGGMTMREMAMAIVDTATRLFPNRPHAAELAKVFRFQAILP